MGLGQQSSESVSFDALLEAVEGQADDYSDAISGLQNIAASSGGSDGLGQIDIVQATVMTTKVQLSQSVLEMTQGVAKNAADWVKKLGQKLTS
ncbi:hypothetical protein DID77_00050 [Candidatus Marinamargulisbacteria bacterium SCGC AG-439-L15]|nr:hypothetical protein DID77_00050 [Candidatus Marinamargulisbacteria bacterium SCGC AG-439-L15]